MTTTRGFMAVAVALLGTTACAQGPVPDGSALPEPTERTVYELRVNAYGSRSQGVRGVLYDPAGQEVAEDGGGQSVETPVGRFRYVACQHLWSVCGYFREGAAVAAYPGPPVGPARHEVMVWRLTMTGEAAAARWHGHLFDDRMAAVPAPAGETRLDTPVGPIVTRSVSLGGVGGEGPLPESWLPR